MPIPVRRKTVEEVEYLGLKTFHHLFGRSDENILGDIGSGFVLTGSGRAALSLILEYLKKEGKIVNKNSQVLVPEWLCQSVLMSMHRHCMPVLNKEDNIRGLLVHHQYGFPQKIDEIRDYCDEKDLFLIEDCATAYNSSYLGKRLGTFGTGSIFSFSKFFPSLLGGALVTDNPELEQFAGEKAQNCSGMLRAYTYSGRFFYECLKDTFLGKTATLSQEMMYAVIDRSDCISKISLRAINKQLNAGAVEKRKRNYNFVLDYFEEESGAFSLLEGEDVTPYIVPFFAGEKQMRLAKENLGKINVSTDIYHFDVNRSILDPDYRKCLWIPVHQGINASVLEEICSTIRKSME
ncbi:MAG: DegT/DnrJ/EryC1/StrS aminotransferase family protein [Methanomicrobiaceae archaeon]|nr:DegT/DnrJ/EryC1/StrS aminotransferase family protein [Methanomicrobiaceae archaeon]